MPAAVKGPEGAMPYSFGILCFVFEAFRRRGDLQLVLNLLSTVTSPPTGLAEY